MNAPIPRIITALRRRNYTHGELVKALDIPGPVLREHIKAIGDLIEVQYNGKTRITLYRLTKATARVDAYMATLGRKPLATRSRIAAALADPSRHIYTSPDDEPFVPKLHFLPVARDPLVSALFGAGGAA